MEHLGDGTDRARVGTSSQDDGNTAGVLTLVFVIDVDNQILDSLIQEGCISSCVMQLTYSLLKQPLLNLKA